MTNQLTNQPPPIAVEHLDQVIDPELRAEIGNPVPITFAATVVYLPLLVGGLLTSIFWTKTITTEPWSPRGLLIDVAAGAAIALVLVLVTYVLARAVKPFELLEREFRTILGHLSHRQIIWIAVLSGAAEELLFRGTLQPWLTGLWGAPAALVVTSLVFGLLHFVPDRVFLPWTIFATVVGFLCGGLFQVFGSVIPPAVAHTLLNAINLELIVNGGRRRHPRG
jgi:membrane protease YdiL (CAAX protease family)